MGEISAPTGPKTIRIGGLALTVPNDAALAAGPSGLSYIYTGGTVYCFSPRGQQISVPATVQAPLRSAYFRTTP
jgi:hypothetical protein